MSNPLSALGRMNYKTFMLIYPATFLFYIGAVKPFLAKKAIDDEQWAWDVMPKARSVDPDLFSPFTPVPYHNSKEMKYLTSTLRMHGYLNENHINVRDYPWKNFHDSYDHSNQRVYTFNWRSMHDATH